MFDKSVNDKMENFYRVLEIDLWPEEFLKLITFHSQFDKILGLNTLHIMYISCFPETKLMT